MTHRINMVMVLESDLAERDAEITRLRMTAAAAEQCAAECDETRAALRKQTQTIDELRDELRLAGQGYADIGHSFDAAQAALSNKKELLAIAEAERDAARAQVVELQAAIQSTVSGLREHDTDYCAGPVGTVRRGACYRCRVARDLDAAIDAKATAPAGYVKAGDDTSAGVDPTVVGAGARAMSDYPEYEKLRAVREQSQSIGEFLEMNERQLVRRACHVAGELLLAEADSYSEIEDLTDDEDDFVREKVREIAERLLERGREAKR